MNRIPVALAFRPLAVVIATAARAARSTVWALLLASLVAAGAAGGCRRAEQQPAPASCFTSKDCPADRICVAPGVCSQPCAHDRDCPAGRTCAELRLMDTMSGAAASPNARTATTCVVASPR